ncbi:hypothetical protein CLG96_08685 [Sphingomonas oleivorans]|uniref:MerC domain-containing protein n=1 Tax=Sphingomonas oleivorans TaxID=1735121 RepID=A0A2T5FYT7_9SPHN|nr:MerC domain-containing protein [Sphingomonas oleivorans]PTQ11682.1 hypothetical protein CLG96_08685 [Sphingomonas oleivorans]
MLRALTDRDLLDRLAIGVSGLCILHCLASIVLVAALTSAGGALLNPHIHEIGLVLATILAGAALGIGVARHRRWLPALTGGIGISLMAGALTVAHGAAETGLTMAGVAMVAIAHLLNRRATA